MKHLSRRDALRGTGVAALAAGAAGLGMPTMAVHDLKEVIDDAWAQLKAAYAQLPPVTAAEYLTEMEANGWLPITRIGHHGRPMGVFEFTRNAWPTQEDMEFLRYMNHRTAKSGRNFYERVAEHLFEQGRGVSYTEFDKQNFRPKGAGVRS